MRILIILEFSYFYYTFKNAAVIMKSCWDHSCVKEVVVIANNSEVSSCVKEAAEAVESYNIITCVKEVIEIIKNHTWFVRTVKSYDVSTCVKEVIMMIKNDNDSTYVSEAAKIVKSCCASILVAEQVVNILTDRVKNDWTLAEAAIMMNEKFFNFCV